MAENIGNVIRVLPGLAEHVDPSKTNRAQPDAKSDVSFTDVFTNLIDSVNELQKESGQIQKAFLSGEPVELHQVMIKAEEAGLATNLLLEIRNRLVNAYNELLRMPI